MRHLRSVTVLAPLLCLLPWPAGPAPAQAQDRARTKEVIVAFAAEPRSLLPNTIVDWTTNDQVEHMYDRLVDRDPKTYKPAPMLATGWKVVNDTTWEFALRQGVKFHNGEPFNAASVKATMDYIKDPANKTHYLPRWAQVKEVQIVNDSTVRFITEKPWPGLIDRIASTDFLPMPPKALKEQGVQALAANPIGTGPFKPGPMQDLRVRKALHHAVNVDELIQQVLKGRASKMCGPLSPLNVDYSPKPQCIKHDPAQAQALFKEAGLNPTKLQLTLDTPAGRYPLDKDVSLAIAAQLQRLGLQVNVGVNEWGTHLDKIKNRTTGDMFFLGWGPALDAQGTIEQLFQGSQTYSSFGGNKAIEAKIAQAVTIVDPKKRIEAWAELQQMVHDEVPWVFLWQQHDLYGVANWIDWTPRADEKVWMYEAKVVPR